MAKSERVREVLTTPLTPDHLRQRAEAGWRAVAVEWERGDAPAAGGQPEEVPFGLRIAEDARRLVEDPAEMEALVVMLEQIVADRSLSTVAEELNRRGFRRRDGSRWTQVAVFNLLPRLIEIAPRIYSTEEWSQRETPGERLRT